MTTGLQIGEELRGHSRFGQSVAFSPDGKQLASGSNSTIRLWNVATAFKLVKSLEVTLIRSVCCIFTRGKQLASGSGDSTIRLWNVTTGLQMVKSFEVTLIGQSVAFSPDAKQLASGSADSTIRLWNVATGLQIGDELEGHSALDAVSHHDQDHSLNSLLSYQNRTGRFPG